MCNKPTVSIIVAMSPNHAIGYQGTIPWSLPEDMRHFRQLTTHHTVIMGRNTFLSLPHGALPHRRNIVLTCSQQHFSGCETFGSLQAALATCQGEVFIIGGAAVYQEALPLADRMYITLVATNPLHADTFFPEIKMSEWQETKKEKHNGFSFVELTRRRQDETWQSGAT